MINHPSKKFEIVKSSKNVSINQLNKVLTNYSTYSNYKDNKWILDKREINQNKTLSHKTIYFSSLSNEGLIFESKEWASKLIIRKYAVRTISLYIHHLSKLTKYIDVNSIYTFTKVTQIEISQLHHFLFLECQNEVKTNVETWVRVKQFFKEMDMFKQYYMMEKFIIPKYKNVKKNNEKYIPDYVTNQLDILFKKNDNIPLAHKTIYWILRLLPNRITEVVSMTNDCLKPITSDSYILTISTPKQSGPYESDMIKMIEIKYVGIGAYLIDLIKAQIKFKKTLDSTNITEPFLFYMYRYFLFKNKVFKQPTKKLDLIYSENFSYFLNRFCTVFEIKDEKGDLFNPTSHQFRHNAISDRMNSGIFRAIDIKPLTGHHTTAMIEQTYTHTSIKDIKKDFPIVFRGRIINTEDEKRMHRLLEKPFARRIHNLGICSDSRACSNSKSQCLRCDFLLPKFENLDYYMHDQSEWIKKKEKAIQIGNVVYSELCQDWIISYEIAIKKVLNAISNEDLYAKMEVIK